MRALVFELNLAFEGIRCFCLLTFAELVADREALLTALCPFNTLTNPSVNDKYLTSKGYSFCLHNITFEFFPKNLIYLADADRTCEMSF